MVIFSGIYSTIVSQFHREKNASFRESSEFVSLSSIHGDEKTIKLFLIKKLNKFEEKTVKKQYFS